MKLLLLALVACLVIPVYALPRPDQIEQRAYDRDNDHPRWCQMYSRRDYWREVRACGDDQQCRWHARRKAERCGIR